MEKRISGKLIAALVAIVFSSTSFIALADNGDQSAGQGQAQSSDSKNQTNNQKGQKGDQGPSVRLGKPSRDIETDADQQNYDQQDGGTSGVAVTGARVFGKRGEKAAGQASGSKVLLLTKHSGNPMATTHIYSIYWGSTFTTGYKDAVNAFLNTISTAPLNTVTNQYFVSPTKNQMTYSGTYLDSTSNPPTSAPTTASILAEVYRAVVTLGKGTLDPAGLYLVFTDNFPSQTRYCAWHGAGSVNKQSFTIAYQPFLGTVSGCSANSMTGYSVGSTISGVDAVANVASHEIYETITDPQLNAWFDSSGAEIGDKCAWYFGSTKVGAYSVQTEWSNAKSGCVTS